MSGLLVATLAGAVGLRSEAAEDASFLFDLFRAHAAPALAQAAVSQQMVDELVAMQHRARTASYRTQYPHARFMIVERDGTPIGRLVEADEPDGVYIVDVAIVPHCRRSGIAAALLGDLQTRLASSGRSVRAEVVAGNIPSRELFRRLGFVERGLTISGGLDLLWRLGRVDAASVVTSSTPCGDSISPQS